MNEVEIEKMRLRIFELEGCVSSQSYTIGKLESMNEFLKRIIEKFVESSSHGLSD